MLTVLERDGRVLAIHPGHGRIVGDEIQVKGRKMWKPASSVTLHLVPDQDTSGFYQEDEQGMRTIVARWPDDFQQFAIDEQEALIDRETEETINAAIHLGAPIGEQFAILREQIAEMLANSGQQPTKRFQALTNIAEAETTKGRKKKDALKE